MEDPEMSICHSCALETGRLAAAEWHSASEILDSEPALDQIVVELLTAPVTRSHFLPARTGF